MLEWIVSSSLLIVLVLLLRRLLRERLSGRLRYALWGIVLVRLLIPVQLFTVPVGISSILPQSDAVEEAMSRPALYGIVDQERTEFFAEQLPKDVPENTREQEEVVSVSYKGQRILGSWVEYHTGCVVQGPEGFVGYRFYADWRDLLLLIWAAGSVLCLVVLTVSNLRFSRRLRRVRVPMEVRCPLPVYQADGLDSPCLCGLLHPAVYVTPTAAEDPTVLRHVLIHEETHYSHKDHIWSVLRCLALGLHWYNPLVWWAVIASKRDGELACDEGALAVLGDGERQAYGHSLLSLLTSAPKAGDFLLCATTMTGDKGSIKERMTRIVCKRKILVGISVTVIIVVLAACVALFGNSGEHDDGAATDLALDRVTTGESTMELVRFNRPNGPVLQDLNQRMAAVKAEYEDWANANPANSSLLYTYPTIGESCISIVMYGQTFPNYGTDGELYAFCYDFVQEREISQTEALAASGWTEDAMHNALVDYVFAHSTDFGYPEEPASFEVNLEIVGFRQRQDGGWDFFLRYEKPQDIYSDEWSYLLTFTDGVILKGIAIPEGETADIGCSLAGLTPYTTEGRSVVMTADQVMAGIKAEDILYVDRQLGGPLEDKEELAEILNHAAEHVVAVEETDVVNGSWWDMTIYLSGGPDGFGSNDQNLRLMAGRMENIVQVRYADRPFYHAVCVEDEALYSILRESYLYEGSVDPVASERYAPQLNAHMEEVLQSFQGTDAERTEWTDPPGGTANYTGYELLDFQEVAVYDDLLPGQVVHLYSFDYGLTMEHPENMFWVGGNYLDGELRMRGMDGYSYFAAALDENGNLVGTRFFWYDLFAGEDEAAGEQNGRETILYSFTHDVEEQ